LSAALVFGALCPGFEFVTLPVYTVALRATALRWGVRSLWTAAGAMGVALTSRFVLGLHPALASHSWMGSHYESQTAFFLFAFLTSPGVVYFASIERRRRAETGALRRLIAHVRADQGFTASLQAVLGELLRLFDARAARLITHDESSGRSFFWELTDSPTANRALRCAEITIPCAGTVRVVSGARRGLDRGLSTGFRAGDWSGRLLLVDTGSNRASAGAARFLVRAMRELTPRLAQVHSLANMRVRAGAIQRARLVRELHDGVTQSLIAAEMHVASLSRGVRSAQRSDEISEVLSRVQDILHREILNLRDMTLQMKPLDVGPEQLAAVLSELVDRFAYDHGVEVAFSTAGGRSPLNRRSCAEIIRIAREALSNVWKHSGARHVRVHVASTHEASAIVVEDDGGGFPFEGDVTCTAEYPTGRHEPPAGSPARVRPGQPCPRSWIPTVIRDSVCALGGSLTIGSRPGHGARLEITIPADPIPASARKDDRKAS
jgi:signal transduction histidine kinase